MVLNSPLKKSFDQKLGATAGLSSSALFLWKSRRRYCPCTKAFTLVEAMVSMVIAAMAGSILFLGVETSLRSTDNVVEQTVAIGIAERMMDDVLGARNASIESFDGYVAQPILDVNSSVLGTGDGEGGTRNPNFQMDAGYFDDWMLKINIYDVDETDHSKNRPLTQDSNFRAIEILVLREDLAGAYRELAKLRRVFADVPML